MNFLRHIFLTVILLAIPAASQAPQAALGENSALRYWSAFAEMRDAALTTRQAKLLPQVLNGAAPYQDTMFKELVEKNQSALATMRRGTSLPNCNWGIDYALGPNAPVEYVRKALELGRLNVLYSYHLLATGKKDAAVHALAAGVQFSHDVASGGAIFAALVAMKLLEAHLRAMKYALLATTLAPTGKQVLAKAIERVGPDGIDWQSAVKQEFAVFRVPLPRNKGIPKLNPQARAALERIERASVSALSNPSQGPEIEKMIASAPQPLPHLIPNLSRVVELKQELARELLQVKSMLQ